MKWEVKYLERLASVYLDKYDKDGYESAQLWFNGFLNDDLREAIKPYVEKEVKKRIETKRKR